MSVFACCIRRNHRQMEDANQQELLKEAPEISWENTLGAPNGVPFDEDTKELLRKCLDVSAPSPATLAQIIKRSEVFPIKFPIKTTRCTALRERGISAEVLEMNANSVYPLIHEAMLPLLARWLKHKQSYGSAIERSIYKDMGLIQFIQRLLEKRAVHFYGPDDRWKLIDGKTGVGGWENVGTDHEKEPLVLTKCLSYDEIKLSALLAMSSHSEFINDGSRENRGVVSLDPDSIQPRGVIIGVVGTRFERQRVMEYQDILVTPQQNTVDNGYGAANTNNADELRRLRLLWAKFYGEEYHPLYDEAVKRVKSKDNMRYLSLSGQTIFDVENYMKRTLVSVEIILLEANTRAEKQNTTAFVHVIGFGLGIWGIIQNQEIYFLKTFEIAIKKMNKKLRFVSDIMFAYFTQQKFGDVGNGDYLGDIKIHFAIKEPHSRLFRAMDANKLLVVTYAWDGNALPGNEFWSGFLSSSGDPATACSSQVAELHTSRINPRACGASLRIASAEHARDILPDDKPPSSPNEISLLQDRACPLGTTGQRRPSRSPRSQRSRSADVDCLKKYTERRVEERRHTDVADTSKLDPSRWIPLTKNMSRSQPTTSKKSPQSSRDDDKRRSVSVDIEETINNIIRSGVVAVPKKLTPTKEEETTKESEEKDEATTTSTTTTTTTSSATTVLSSTLPTTHRTGGRSLSTDVGRARNEKLVEERRHTEADPRMIATRWLPQINISRFRYDASSFTRISNTDITKLAAARWLTFVKNPSPSPIPRMNPERKPSTTTTTKEQAGDQVEENLRKETKNVSPKWEPIRKFSSVTQAKSDRDDAAKEKGEAESNRASPSSELSPDSAERSKRLTQRMKDLYDFKTENEWPKRVVNVCRENMWISKSSSEEERPSQPARRNSQDLEFNDRVNVIKLRDTKVQSDFQTPKDPAPKKEDPPKSSEIFDSEYEERIRKFNERLRFSEDLGVAKPKLKERRTYSDDSEEKVRRSKSARSARSESVQERSQPLEGKRNSDASSRSRGSYAEVSPVKRDSRTSTASYASVGSTKRASIDCKSTTQMVEVPPRRAFSQTEKRPATPVPPIEFNDDRYAAGRSKPAECQKRNSTRYKVYLT